MSFIRLGFTESTLLFYFFIEEIRKENLSQDRKDSQKSLINWLYTTSGFYDETIKGSHFDFSYEECKKSMIYREYFNRLYLFFKRNKERNIVNNIQIHGFPESYNSLITTFKQELNIREATTDMNEFFNFVRDRNIVIVNPMSELMESQYKNGNVKKVYENFPNIKSITCYINPYTFFNKGNDRNIFETAKKINSQLKELVKNIENPYIVISCGAYSNLIAEEYENVYVVGGLLLSYFAIKHGRHGDWCKGQYGDYWVEVPVHLKPANYEKIENGCYW
jgi:hypothetical protein